MPTPSTITLTPPPDAPAPATFFSLPCVVWVWPTPLPPNPPLSIQFYHTVHSSPPPFTVLPLPFTSNRLCRGAIFFSHSRPFNRQPFCPEFLFLSPTSSATAPPALPLTFPSPYCPSSWPPPPPRIQHYSFPPFNYIQQTVIPFFHPLKRNIGPLLSTALLEMSSRPKGQRSPPLLTSIVFPSLSHLVCPLESPSLPMNLQFLIPPPFPPPLVRASPSRSNTFSPSQLPRTTTPPRSPSFFLPEPMSKELSSPRIPLSPVYSFRRF